MSSSIDVWNELSKKLSSTETPKLKWDRIVLKNAKDKFTNNLLKLLAENISDEKLVWLNSIYDNIFNIDIFIDGIKKSKYLFLDTKNNKVIRKKLFAESAEFVPFKNNNITTLDTNAPEFNPPTYIHQEMIINNMMDDLLN
jgi:hypothetical protein